MKRYKKKELLESVSTLIKANDTIVKSVRANPGGVSEALASCQESAILMGTYLESLDEKYAGLVRLLEDYCENVYQMSEAVPDEVRCRKIAKKIQKQLSLFRHGITYDLPEDRKEVVFLPYKASMWDSLESVWRAADADENTDAYVIPIPYYDKNPDGSFRKMHYEGDQYPSYVPITKYDAYDLEERRPDEIYIHNGYDACNFITSVDPLFYSDRLKQFTDCLVYIPYFVLREPDPDNADEVKNLSHLCTVPAVLHADRVIVQSEAMKKVYVKALMEVTENQNGAAKQYWENKIEGTGSPKLDKVAHTRREDVEIPAEWRRIIYKPDGTPKKIVFYNNSISALLRHNEKMIAKMESVFAICKENQDEIALLWRPHPLIESTLTSMRPRLWEAYKSVRDKYLAEGWGIYDDTADIDRAIIASDAYYGDPSSVVQMYGLTGKPMMLQEIEASGREQAVRPVFFNWVRHGGGMWFWDTNYNGLFFIRDGAETAENVPLKCSEGLGRRTGSKDSFFTKVGVSGDDLIFSPCRYDSILIYHIGTKTEEYIPLPDVDWWEGRTERGKFGDIVIDEDYAFLIGDWCTYLVRLDLRTKEVRAVNLFASARLRQECSRYLFDLQGVQRNPNPDVTPEIQFFQKGILREGKLLISVVGSSRVLAIDRVSLTVESIRISDHAYGFADMCCRGKDLWLLPMVTEGYPLPVMRYDMETGAAGQFADYPEALRFHSGLSFRFLLEKDGRCYLLPGTADKVVVLDENLSEMTALEELSARLAGADSQQVKTFFAEIAGNTLCIYSKAGQSFLEMELPAGEVKERIVHISDEYRRQRRRRVTGDLLEQKKGYIHEKHCPLQSFLDYCVSCRH